MRSLTAPLLLISLAHDCINLVANADDRAERQLLVMMNSPSDRAWSAAPNICYATYCPPWNPSAAALELRSQFLLQAVVARYLRVPNAPRRTKGE